ncbi:MAG: MFS transporter [Steroidobacteraceae bacterium]
MNNQQRVADSNVTIMLCILATFCEGINLQAAGVAAAGIVGEHHPDARTLGAFFSASTLGLFIGALLGGKLADHVGRKLVLVSSVGIFGVFSLLTAAAWDMSSLTWMRLLTGLGLGGALPNLIALVAESSSEDRRNANVTLVYAGTPLGGALISLVSMLSPSEAWRWMFIIGGVVPLLITPVMARYLPESARLSRRSQCASEFIAGIEAQCLAGLIWRGACATYIVAVVQLLSGVADAVSVA